MHGAAGHSLEDSDELTMVGCTLHCSFLRTRPCDCNTLACAHLILGWRGEQAEVAASNARAEELMTKLSKAVKKGKALGEETTLLKSELESKKVRLYQGARSAVAELQ